MDTFWYIKTIEYYSALTEMSDPPVKRHGGTLNAYYYVKEANLGRWDSNCMHFEVTKVWKQ